MNKLKSIMDRPVTVTPHRSLNSCKGVIRYELIDCDKQEILSELKLQAVADITNITVRDNSGGRKNTNTFILTFKQTTIPQHIKIGHIRVPVTVYIPNPLRCFKCQKFGHGQKNCRGKAICAKHGQQDHRSDECSNEAKCPNCSGSHTAFSKNCPKWLLEKRVQHIRAERNISFIETRKITTAESKGSSAPPHCTAAAVVGSSSRTSRPAARSIDV